ncbi:hypothetical protein FRB96_001314 [Tulasnella sp. 330]|nr:hypothetical protein FRB96_001314 [Tulasnella sp. 330]
MSRVGLATYIFLITSGIRAAPVLVPNEISAEIRIIRIRSPCKTVLSLPRITLPLGPEDWASIAKPNLRDEMQVELIKAARTATATLIQQGTTTASVQKKKPIRAHIDAKQLEAMTLYLRQVSNEKLASVRLAMVNGKLMILENVAKKIEGGSMA